MCSCPCSAPRGNALVRISIRGDSRRALERERLWDLQKLTEHNVLFAMGIKREFLMAALTHNRLPRVWILRYQSPHNRVSRAESCFQVNQAFQAQDPIKTELHFWVMTPTVDWELSCFFYFWDSDCCILLSLRDESDGTEKENSISPQLDLKPGRRGPVLFSPAVRFISLVFPQGQGRFQAHKSLYRTQRTRVNKGLISSVVILTDDWWYWL